MKTVWHPLSVNARSFLTDVCNWLQDTVRERNSAHTQTVGKEKKKKIIISNKNALNMTLIALCYGKMAESITTALMGANSVCWTPRKTAVDALHLCMKGCITFAGLFLQKLEELIISILQLTCLQNTVYSKNNIRILVVPVLKLRGLCLVSQTSENNFCPN